MHLSFSVEQFNELCIGTCIQDAPTFIGKVKFPALKSCRKSIGNYQYSTGGTML